MYILNGDDWKYVLGYAAEVLEICYKQYCCSSEVTRNWFQQDDRLSRRPIALTCSFFLEMPIDYSDFIMNGLIYLMNKNFAGV